jgi:hypothetical protein
MSAIQQVPFRTQEELQALRLPDDIILHILALQVR